MMKNRLIATFVMAAMMAVMVPLMSTSASAQTKRYNNRTRSYSQQSYKKPNVYKRHRNVINLGIGAGAGAIIGAIAGGKKGAAIGALIGGGGAAAYTYGINPKKKKQRYYNNRRY